jgi:hypothetical protein
MLFCSQAILAQSVTQLWQKFNAEKKPGAKVSVLKSLLLINGIKDQQFTDSIAEEAQRICRLNGLKDSALAVYKVYYDYVQEPSDSSKLQQFYTAANASGSDYYKCYANMAMANYYRSLNNLQQATSYALEAKSQASNAGKPRLVIQAKLCHGRALVFDNKKVEAFRNFNVALHESKLLEDPALINNSRYQLVEFYRNVGNLDKAEQLVQEQLQDITKTAPIDSFEYMSVLRIAAQIYFQQKNASGEKQATQLVLDYAIRNNLPKLRQDILTQIRSNAFESDNFNSIKDVYCIKFPTLLAELAQHDSLAYLKVKSVIAETDNKKDSAEYYLKMAESLCASKSVFFISNFYKRLGEFYIRQNNVVAALPHFITAFENAQLASHYAWCKENALVIEQIYQQQGKFQEAYKYSKFVQSYEDSLHLTNDVNQQLKLEIENEASYSLKLQERKELLHQKKKNLQTTAVVIIILTLFVVLTILSSIKMPRMVIKGVAFISFIFFFEFIILLADEKIHHATHGEPLKIMGIKLVLISILLPLHHWVEHKVVHYLAEHRLIDAQTLRNFWSNVKLKFKEIYAGIIHD